MKGIQYITEFNDFHVMANGAVRSRHDDVQVFEFSEIGKDANKSTPLFKTNFYQVGLFSQIAFEVEYFGKAHVVDKKNAVVLFKPGQLVSFKSDPEARGYAILFKEHFIDWRLNNHNTIRDFPILDPSFDCVMFLPNEAYNDLSDIAAKMLHEYLQPLDTSSLNIIRLYAQLLLEKINRLQKNVSIPSLNNRQLKTSHEFKSLVYKNIYNTKSVSEYAKMLSITEKTLVNHFKTSMGITPKDFINAVIINESKALLANMATVEQVADYFNFTDQSHFSNFFRKQTGARPRDFQKPRR